jgi:hypothetical protein
MAQINPQEKDRRALPAPGGGDAPQPDPVTKAEFDQLKTESTEAILKLTETLDTLGQSMNAHFEQMKSVTDTMKELQEWKKTSVERTQAEIMNANSQQLEAAQTIEGRQRKEKTLEDYGFETIDRRIFDGYENATHDEQKDILRKALTHPTNDPVMHQFHKYCDSMKLRCAVLDIKPRESKYFPKYEKFLQDTGLEKVINISGAPSNFIPESWSAEMLTYYYQELMVASAFESFTMPNDPFRYDILGRPTTYLRSQPTASTRGSSTVEYTASDPAQGVVTFTTVEMAARVDIARRFDEDALDAYMPTLEQVLIPGAMAEAKESATVNGDNSETSFDLSITDAANVRKAYKGLRYHANLRSATVDIEASSGVYSFDRFADVLLKGGRYFIKPAENVWVMSNSAYFKALKFDEIKTTETYPMPTNINGVVNVILGRPVIVTGEYPLTLNATGIDPATASTQTGFLCANTKCFMFGERRMDEVETMRDILTGFWYIVATNRHDLQAMEPVGTDFTPVVAGINLTS